MTTPRGRPHRMAGVLATALLVAGLLATHQPSATADFHEMKITEVHAGDTGIPAVEAVELRMYTANQHFVGGHVLKFFDAAGTTITDCTVPSNVGDGTPQSHVLFATNDHIAAYGSQPDFTFAAPLIDGTGGAICWGAGADCVTWGSFGGSVSDGDGPVVNPEPAIPDDSAIHRNLNNATLEDGDDTNNSNDDFAPGEPDAMENGSSDAPLSCQPGTPTSGGAIGPGGGGGGDVTVNNLKVKTPGNKAVVAGAIDPPEPGGSVKLTLFANGSPLRKVAKKSDTLDTESEFRKKFTVPSDSTRCKVTVKYDGQEEAKKKFTC